MDQLNFNISLEDIVISIFLTITVYYLVAGVSYLSTIFLGVQMKKITDSMINIDQKSIFMVVLPFFASAIIFLMIIQIFLIPLYVEYFLHTGFLFVRSLENYLLSIISFIIGITCLSLTRYSFAKNWKVIGRLENRRTISNFFILTTLILILFIICMRFSKLLPTFPMLTILITYLFLKCRNINKPIIVA